MLRPLLLMGSSAVALGLSLVDTPAAYAIEGEVSPEFAAAPSVQLRLFPENGEEPLVEKEFPYSTHWAPSAALELEAGLHTSDDRFQLQSRLFGRLDATDEQRTHADVREAYILHAAPWISVQVGMGVVFWGVTESTHLVDIINQADLLEEPTGEVKLGQPLWRLSLSSTDWGSLNLFVLPFFRERVYPGPRGRPRYAIPVNEGASTFDSEREERNVSAAARWSGFHGSWDWGLSYFYGTSREPQLRAQPSPGGGLTLVPHYDLIHQAGLELQWTGEAWLWKLEAMARQGQGPLFGAAVAGFEYTLYELVDGADVGLVAEGGYDGRDNDAFVIMDHDAFAGVRWNGNDVQSTTALLGAIVDVEHGATVLRAEGSRRLGESFQLSLESYLFLPSKRRDIVWFLEGESYLSLALTYFR